MHPRLTSKVGPLLSLLIGLSVTTWSSAQNAAATTTPTETTETAAAAKAADAIALEKFEVTGSRIPRLDTETVSPVVTFTATTLTNTGFPTIGDALRSMPMNSGQALTPTDSGTSFTPGVSTVNLRGLGNNNTLVLINGRRAVPYAAPGFNGLQTVFDINSIPDAAIDRVEILKDGGSAIYGSDAVGGVINFILKKDYTGLDTTFEYGNYARVNAPYRKVSAVAGAHSAKTSLFVSASWEEQDKVDASQLPWSKNADQSSRAHKSDPRYVWDGWETLDWPNDIGMPKPANAQDALAAIEPLVGLSSSPIADGFFDLRSSRGFPGYVVVGGKRRTFAHPTGNPTVADSIGGYNPYNFQETSGLFPGYRRYSIYSRMQHDFSYSMYVFAELSFTRTETESAAAATPADIETSHGLSPETNMVLPAYNPYNPWGVDITSGRRRMIENGSRLNQVTADTPRLLAGLGGKLDNIPALESWSWETGVQHSKSTVTNLNAGSVSDSGLQEALNGLTRNGDGSLSWNPATPQNQRVYYNWFGYNDASFVNFLNIENPNVATLTYTSLDFSAGGDVLEFKGGKIGLALGGEHRDEKFADVKTLLNSTGNILGGSEGTSAFGNRQVSSLYAEVDVSLLDKLLEFQFAGRYEQYSDKGFENKMRPKVGVKIRPVNWLVLRGSYSEAFKAPDLDYLYAAGSTSFTSGNVHDPVTGATINQLQINTAGNRNLRPENTRVYYAGVTLDAPGILKGLTLDVDYFKYKQNNLLAQLSDFYGYSDFLVKAAAGDPLFADKVVRDPNTNEVLYLFDTYVNISTGAYEGIDYAVNYNWETENYGKFHAGAAATGIDKLLVDGNNVVGSYLTARWNFTGTFGWNYRDWSVNVYEIVRGKRYNTLDFGPLVDDDDFYIKYRIKEQYLTNASVTYSGIRNTRVTLGVNNAFNSEPPEDAYNQTGSTTGINNLEPLFWYLRVERSF